NFFWVAADDFNLDNKPDIAAVSGLWAMTFLNQGAGVFGGPMWKQALQQGGAADIAIGDVNKDGQVDVVTIANLFANTGIIVNQGGGALTMSSTYNDGMNGVALADINKDGKLDLIEAGGGSAFVTRLGNGDGTFQGPVSVNGVTANRIIAADLNSDG